MERLSAIVLGSAAGGAYPQWNCRCPVCALAWAGDPRVKPRTQCGLAVSADGEAWTLLNASPDLGAQIRATPALHPRRDLRGSPIKAVVLTGGEIDQIAGLLSLRESTPVALHATAVTNAAVNSNMMLEALTSITRHAVRPGEKIVLAGGLQAELFLAPGKVPLWLEGEEVRTAEETAANVGIEIVARGQRLVFLPGVAAISPELLSRLRRAHAILIDGTLFTDDEMIRSKTGQKTGRRMGHMPIDGEDGTLAALDGLTARKIFIHINNTNPILIDGSPERRKVETAGWEVAEDGMEIVAVKLLTPDELEAGLRKIGAERYHRLHPFHTLLHGGKCTKGQVQAWALNRYYYQAMIPIKDANLIARCDDPNVRRIWRSRLVDHDGEAEGEGGIARWLKLTDGLGLDRDYVTSLRGLLPGTRFAVEAYVHFVREKSLLEAIASSLTELFSPVIISERMSGMLANYDFVTRETLSYFDQRPPQAQRDADFALGYVKHHARTPDDQQKVLAALEFKCGVLWSMLDALHFAYVSPGDIPPGAFVPDK